MSDSENSEITVDARWPRHAYRYPHTLVASIEHTFGIKLDENQARAVKQAYLLGLSDAGSMVRVQIEAHDTNELVPALVGQHAQPRQDPYRMGAANG